MQRLFWWRTQSAIPEYDVGNTIDAGTTVRGELRGAKGFRIDGTVDGSIESTGAVIIGDDGVVTGSVRGSNVIVLGRVEGEVDATGHIEVGPRGRILGDVRMTSIRVHRGGALRGMSAMPLLDEAEAPATSATRPRTLPPPRGEAVPPAPLPHGALRSAAAPPALPPDVTSRHRLVARTEPAAANSDGVIALDAPHEPAAVRPAVGG